MHALPNIPRMYTAFAAVLAVLLYAQPLPPRWGKRPTIVITAGWAVVLCLFLHETGMVPLAFWIPCMLCAVTLLYL